MATTTLEIVAGDGPRLEAELAAGADARCGMVLCHPHPQYGGTMRSLVISALFGALPALGVTCLRFNFRGVEGSEGFYDDGRGERLDAQAAVASLAERLPATAPLLLTGWSFGADVALSTLDPRLAGWVAIAPPLRSALDPVPAGGDERPKLVVLAEHDEVRPPAEIEAVTRPWPATETVVVPGASHFFVGRTARLVELAARFVDQVTAPAAGDGSGPSG